MDVALLVVSQCPNEHAAARLLRRALNEVGLAQVQTTTVVVTDERHAARLSFIGSPTIMINGVDPFAEPGRTPGLACRIYRTAGGISGTPDESALRAALRRTIEPSGSTPATQPTATASTESAHRRR